jgi:hypothetical protein
MAKAKSAVQAAAQDNGPTVSPVFKRAFAEKLLSGTNLLWITIAGDEGRVERAIEALITKEKPAGFQDFHFFTWDAVTGASWHPVVPNADKTYAARAEQLRDPLEVLQTLVDRHKRGMMPVSDCVTIMRDLHKFLNDERHFGLRRMVLEACKNNLLSNQERMRPIVVISDTPVPHPDIREFCDVIDFALPNADEVKADVIGHVIGSINEGRAKAERPPIAVNDEMEERLAQALLGTSAQESTRILAYAVATCGGVNDNNFAVIAKEKAHVIQKVEGLKFIPTEEIPPIDHFGGFSAFTKWLQIRALMYGRMARNLQQELPRGCVLIGPPGTGKTEIAKAAAKVLGLDLVIMDIGALFDKFVGGTEKKIRAAIQTIDALPQCCLMVD